ncbi:MAG TPA: hypothetical protein VGW35_24440 [Methylomirabilota bacterium]|jgi:hypothetical protein|nr:hypothetical protein [Methylomirabilota bacterium]
MRHFVLVGLVATVLAAATVTEAYNGGPVLLITDLASSCAGCHASMQKEQLRNAPEALQNAQWVENKHYKQIEAGDGPYKDMTPGDRARLLTDVKAVDAAAAAALTGPASARPGQEITVTATVRGGAGPVVGVFLVDTDVRFQTRPVSADGWFIVGAPKVTGPDGQPQTRWTDGRAEGLRKNLNSALVFNHKSDLEKKAFPESKVVWTLRAPQEPGTYTLYVAFHYGTEKASPVGTVERTGTVLPRGGPGGPSGHILFSKPVSVTVR